jgi:hypothetical protein
MLYRETGGENTNRKPTVGMSSKPGVFALQCAAKVTLDAWKLRRESYDTSEELGPPLSEIHARAQDS